jgi:hypothetical protein
MLALRWVPPAVVIELAFLEWDRPRLLRDVTLVGSNSLRNVCLLTQPGFACLVVLECHGLSRACLHDGDGRPDDVLPDFKDRDLIFVGGI